MAKHKTFTVATNVKVYFCDPQTQSPWQRGSNENKNGLLRQYFPKRKDLPAYTQSELDKVALRLNQRPRKTFRLPRVDFEQLLRPPIETTALIGQVKSLTRQKVRFWELVMSR